MLDFNQRTINILNWASNIAHMIISLALVSATILIAIFFFHEVYQAIQVHSLIKGFLHALGILLLLWTMVELISTEIKYLQGEGIDVAVFIEVALVVIVREIIMLPVEDAKLEWIDIGMWTGGAALLGLTYLFVRLGQSLISLKDPKVQTTTAQTMTND